VETGIGIRALEASTHHRGQCNPARPDVRLHGAAHPFPSPLKTC